MRNSRSILSSSRAGFSLIELMVVIAIISILANFAILQTGKILSKARDARRLTDIYNIQIALKQYLVDNGTYPLDWTLGPRCGGPQPNNAWCTSNDASWDNLAARLAPYLPKLPKDPYANISGGWAADIFGYSYCYPANAASDYLLVYQLENSPTPPNTGYTDSTGGNWNYGFWHGNPAVVTTGGTT